MSSSALQRKPSTRRIGCEQTRPHIEHPPGTSDFVAEICRPMLHRVSAIIATSLAVVFCALSPCLAQTSSQDRPADWHFSFELFQMLLEENGLKTVVDFNDLGSNPKDCLIVSVGNVGNITSRNIQRFTASGGAVFLASDQEQPIAGICNFRSGPVIAELERERYQTHRDCLLITDLTQDNPIVAGVRSLVANKSGWIDKPSWPALTWEVAARLPADTQPSNSNRKTLIARIPTPQNSGGMLIVCAYQSMFSNWMLWHADNAVLAINVSKLLSSWRRKVLFLSDGVPLSSFRNSPQMNPAKNPPPLPGSFWDLDTATQLRLANSVIKNLEQSNLINQAMANRPKDMSPPHYLRAFLFVLAAFALAFIIWRLSSNSPTTSEPMPTRQMLTAHALISQQKANAAEFGVSASMLARELCRELTDSTDSHVWMTQLSADRLQQSAASGKSLLENKLSSVLDLAVRPGTLHIPQKKFLSIGNTIQELRQLHRNQQLFKPSST